MTIGLVWAFVNYLGKFWAPISTFSRFWSQILSAMASAERVFTILDLKPEAGAEVGLQALQVQEVQSEPAASVSDSVVPPESSLPFPD